MPQSRPGRPRKQGARQPNGQPSRVDSSPAILQESIDRRRDLAPISATDDDLRSSDYGSPIAILAARGAITPLQMEAALRAERIYAKWRFMCGAPARHVSDHVGGGGQSIDPDQRAWLRAKADYEALERCIGRVGILGRTTLESIVFDAWYPAIWFERNGGMNAGYSKAAKGFKDALDAIVKEFGLEARNPLAA